MNVCTHGYKEGTDGGCPFCAPRTPLSSKTDLAPCPFCEDAAHLRFAKIVGGARAVNCTLCGAVGPHSELSDENDAEEDAREMWNRRRAAETAVAQAITFIRTQGDMAVIRVNGKDSVISPYTTFYLERAEPVAPQCEGQEHVWQPAEQNHEVCALCDVYRRAEKTSVPYIDCKRFETAPFYLCGYNGPDYFQKSTHSCAEAYHIAKGAT